ncbi:WAT1-related protein At5g40240-like isoform X1 [Mercurialis annua]|uniref:WAT1-related protein At5g40240-like isoform X1 n=1 Tax=Mercurialis annua TaxID=3986 RepID=UPI00215F8731|nr:WAT1-related protein At5g40240-like isoform X1 [Mercurialis annua]XP_050221161.1 WAT1-related protein At5g40240-like isoform X1 [Mercurialis annua]
MVGNKWFDKEVMAFAATISVECANVGVNILYYAAALKGMSYYVFILYTYAIATLFLLPVPFIYFRTSGLPSSLKLPVLFRICILAFIGFLAQVVGNKGLEYTSPTLASAMSNLTPASTFILAAIFRMEKLRMSSSSSQAKIFGTMASVTGALVVILYKGPSILSNSSSPTPTLDWPLYSPNSKWLIGGFLLAMQCILYSLWYILQSQILKICPIELLVTFVYTLCVTIISAPICLVAENNSDAWRLKPDIALIAIIYSAMFGRCYSTIVHSWGLRLKGPLYVAIFKPFSIAIAAILSVIFFQEDLNLGIVMGAIVISIGFYGVIWGKANEDDDVFHNLPSLKDPTHSIKRNNNSLS